MNAHAYRHTVTESTTDGRQGVLAFGEVLTVLVQQQPGPLAEAMSFRRAMGGAEANVAVALRALGVPAGVLTRVGDDGFGRALVAELGRLGVDTAAVGIDTARPTGLYVKEVGGDTLRSDDLGHGRSAMHYYRAGSAASAVTPEMLDEPAVAGAVSRARLLHTTGITPALSDGACRTQQELVRRVHAGGALVSLDVNWRPVLWKGRETAARDVLTGFARCTDILFTGQDEARAVFEAATPEDVRALFPQPRLIVVKNDGGAATAFDGDRRVDLAPDRIDVVEAIGAGDAFAAGFLAGVLAGDGLVDCVSRAHAVAAQALRTSGDHVGDDVGASS